MKQSTKNILIALAIIIPLGSIFLFGTYAYNYFKKITFLPPTLGRLDYLDVANTLITKGKNSVIPVMIMVPIKNDNKRSISFSDLYVELFHDGKLIAQTSALDSNYDKIIIKGNQENSFPYSVDVFVNDQLLSLLKTLDIFGGQKATLQYKVKANLFGWLPFSWDDVFEYPDDSLTSKKTV